MTHNYHLRLNEMLDTLGPSPLFFDGCKECERKATEPLLWGGALAPAMWSKMVEVEYEGVGSYRSNAEAVAGREAYHLSIFMERNAGLSAAAVRLMMMRILNAREMTLREMTTRL